MDNPEAATRDSIKAELDKRTPPVTLPDNFWDEALEKNVAVLADIAARKAPAPKGFTFEQATEAAKLLNTVWAKPVGDKDRTDAVAKLKSPPFSIEDPVKLLNEAPDPVFIARLFNISGSPDKQAIEKHLKDELNIELPDNFWTQPFGRNLKALKLLPPEENTEPAPPLDAPEVTSEEQYNSTLDKLKDELVKLLKDAAQKNSRTTSKIVIKINDPRIADYVVELVKYRHSTRDRSGGGSPFDNPDRRGAGELVLDDLKSALKSSPAELDTFTRYLGNGGQADFDALVALGLQG
jgi:hypothetical protein